MVDIDAIHKARKKYDRKNPLKQRLTDELNEDGTKKANA